MKMVARLGNVVYWMSILIAVLGLFYFVIYDGVVVWKISLLASIIVFIGWAIRYVLSGTKKICP
jgi:hypothetical protein